MPTLQGHDHVLPLNNDVVGAMTRKNIYIYFLKARSLTLKCFFQHFTGFCQRQKGLTPLIGP